jgi:hypothetical protein
VSKKSASEKRKAKKQKAISQGSPSALRTLAQRNPEAGARAILRALQTAPSTTSDPDVAALAEDLCERLRAEDAFDLSLQLASAFHRRTPRFCLEEALAAFALGDDERAKDAASASGAVQSALAPILAVAKEAKVPRTPPRASPDLRGLIALARCVVGLESGKLSNATTALRQIPEEAAGRLYAKEMALAARVVAGRRDGVEHDAIELASTTLVRRNPRMANALAHCLAHRAPQRFIELVSRIPLSETAKADALIEASTGATGLESDEARASLLVAKLGHEAFPKEQQGVAALYEGFTFCAVNPQRALKVFDRAMELGADVVEALRGRYLAQRGLFERARDYDREEGAARAVGSTAMRLHALVDAHPNGAPFAAVMAENAAQFLGSDRDPRRALDAIKAARASASRAGLLQGPFEASLLFLEAQTLEFTRPLHALGLVKRALEVDPKHHHAWHLHINLTQAHRGIEEAQELILQAAELNVCPELVAQAATIRLRRGVPLTLVPGRTQPGEIALELKRRCDREGWTAAGSPYPDDVAACRASLGPDERRAIDAAAYEILSQRQRSQGVAALLRVLRSEKDTRDETFALLACLGASSGWEGTVFEIVNGADTPALTSYLATVALDSYVSSGRLPAAQKLLMGIAAKLSTSQLNTLRKRIDNPSGDGIHAAVQRAAQILEPHYHLASLVVPDESPRLAQIGQSWMKRIMRDAPKGMDRAEVMDIIAQMAELMTRPPNKQSTRKMETLCFRLGITPEDFFDELHGDLS